jgi:hypothetical protein
MRNQFNYWLLGDLFLRNYYSVWDHDNNRIALGVHITSNAEIIPASNLPEPTEEIKSANLVDLAFIFAGVSFKAIGSFAAISGTVFIVNVIITNLVRYL